MFAQSPCLNATIGLAVRLCLTVIECKVTCIFFAVALLLVSQMKAQEKAYSVNDLVQRLRSQVINARRSAAIALGQIGKDALPALIAALKDQDVVVRSSAAGALGQIGKDAVPALIAALKDQDAGVR